MRYSRVENVREKETIFDERDVIDKIETYTRRIRINIVIVKLQESLDQLNGRIIIENGHKKVASVSKNKYLQYHFVETVSLVWQLP